MSSRSTNVVGVASLLATLACVGDSATNPRRGSKRARASAGPRRRASWRRLSQNRKTPNMGLRHATTDAGLRALENKWVRLVVGATAWSISEVTSAEADAFWQAHKPQPVTLPAVDLSVTELRNIEDDTPEGNGKSLRDAIKAAIPAWGGKAAHYSILAKTDAIHKPPATS